MTAPKITSVYGIPHDTITRLASAYDAIGHYDSERLDSMLAEEHIVLGPYDMRRLIEVVGDEAHRLYGF
jgi:hypothetical protein